MLADIRISYDSKISELKEQYVNSKDQNQLSKDDQGVNYKELNETLKREIESLKQNYAWLKKDNVFKTEQLDIFLADCGTKNEQLYNLRKNFLSKSYSYYEPNYFLMNNFD